jgi:5-methylcytosine-specific restriction protein A
MVMEWTRPELTVIVAAMHEAAEGGEWSWIRATTPKAAELSALLRTSMIWADGPADPKFRSVSAIQRKAENLRTARTGYLGKTTNGSALDLAVVADYESNPEAVLREAAASTLMLQEGGTAFLPATEDDEILVAEGKAVMRKHLSRERARGLRAKKLESVNKVGIPIACDVCGMNFGKFYGPRGEGYIEVHHIRPLHDSGPVQTALADLALLCANCHRMIHRNPWLTPTQLKATLS